jgi:hypothetical protein
LKTITRSNVFNGVCKLINKEVEFLFLFLSHKWNLLNFLCEDKANSFGTGNILG